MRQVERAVATTIAGLAVVAAAVLVIRYPWFRHVVASDDRTANPLAAVVLAVAGVTWAVSGLIVVLRTGNVVGWISLVVGLCLAPMWMGWSAWMLQGSGELEALSYVLAYVFDFTWVPAVVLTVVVLPLVFPSGRPPAGRWVWVMVVAVLAVAGGLLAVAQAREGWSPHSALQALSGFFFQGFEEPMPWALFGAPLLVGVAGAGASVVSRLRTAGTVERQQAKWVVTALVTTAIVAVVSFLGPLEGLVRTSLGPVLVVGCYGLVPVAVVVAILRYRLFDINRLVSRAVTYTIVVSLLAALYAGSVVGLRRWLPGEGQIPVAASTLAVAACFLPLARRVQRAVDRRFFRSRYDAGLVVDRLVADLREPLDPNGVVTRTEAVVAEVFSPERLGTWLADGRARPVASDGNHGSWGGSTPVAGEPLDDQPVR